MSYIACHFCKTLFLKSHHVNTVELVAKMMSESSQFVSTLPSMSQSTDPSPTSAKSRVDQPMFPVTVKQIAESAPSHGSNANFLIDGVEVYNVKLVGMVFNKVVRITDVSFVIDDGTGRIGCNRWVNDSHDNKEVNGLTDGMHVRIHGHLKNFKGNKQIVVFAIRPVTDYNEIANHFLECIHAHCLHSRLQGVSASSSSPAVVTPNASSSPAVATPNGYQAVSSSQNSEDEIGNTNKRILDFVRHPSYTVREEGVHQDEIAQNLKIPQEKLTEALAFLVQEGMMYSTIDEFHYKSSS